MNFAIDENGNKVNAYDANKEGKYICPCCGNEVIPKMGELNVWHFAHKVNECTDNWHYDMSEWHSRMQSFFKPEHQEVVVKYNNECHRADILKDGVVIEFQHSPISVSEFCSRNDFWIEAGYRIAWVFDISTQWDSGAIYPRTDDGSKLRWKNPLRMLKYGSIPQDNSKDLSICLCSSYEVDYDNLKIRDNINRVNWSSLDNDDNPDYRYLSICPDCYITLEENMDMNVFFFTPFDFIKFYTKNLRPYNIKINGKLKGYNKSDYCCPITNNWINRNCRYCGHCGFEENFNIQENNISKFFCCYPRIVNKKVDEEFRIDHEYQCVFSIDR